MLAVRAEDFLTKTDIVVAYTESINLMDFSAVVIPVTKADKRVDKFDAKYQPLNEQDRKNWEACKSTSCHPLGLSISILIETFRRCRNL